MASAAPDVSNPTVPASWIVGLAILALALRTIGLDSGLWVDEIYSLLRSFRPPLARRQPVVKNKAWPRQPLDYFVLARLEQTNLSPSVVVRLSICPLELLAVRRSSETPSKETRVSSALRGTKRDRCTSSYRWM